MEEERQNESLFRAAIKRAASKTVSDLRREAIYAQRDDATRTEQTQQGLDALNKYGPAYLEIGGINLKMPDLDKPRFLDKRVDKENASYMGYTKFFGTPAPRIQLGRDASKFFTREGIRNVLPFEDEETAKAFILGHEYGHYLQDMKLVPESTYGDQYDADLTGYVIAKRLGFNPKFDFESQEGESLYYRDELVDTAARIKKDIEARQALIESMQRKKFNDTNE